MIKASQTCIKHTKSAFFCCALEHIIWERKCLSVSLYIYYETVNVWATWFRTFPNCLILHDSALLLMILLSEFSFRFHLKTLTHKVNGQPTSACYWAPVSSVFAVCSAPLALAKWLIEHVKSVWSLHNFSWAFQYVNIIITKLNFQQCLLQSSVSCDPSEIILIWAMLLKIFMKIMILFFQDPLNRMFIWNINIF